MNSKRNTNKAPNHMVRRCEWANRGNKTGRRETKTNLRTIHQTRKGRKRKWKGHHQHMLPRKHDTHEHMEKGTSNKRGKQTIKQSTQKEQQRNAIALNNINTWASPGGQVHRQIDYIAINNKYRNAVRKACAEQHWR